MTTIGIIKPSTRPGRAEELVAMLPPELRFEHDNLNVDNGTPEELRRAIREYEPKIERMVALGCDLVHTAGAPPLLLGYTGELERVRAWELRYGRPIFTNGMSQVNALRALGARRIVGASYFPGDINLAFGRYLDEAGFEVLELRGMEVEFKKVPLLPQADIEAFLAALVGRHPRADALYLLGPAWKTLDMIEALERKFDIPIVHHIPAQSWEIQKRLRLRYPVPGFGRLVKELPGGVGE